MCKDGACSTVLVLEQRVTGLERWQEAQNGAILRLESKIDRLQLWLLGTLASSVLSLAGMLVQLLR